MRAIYPYSTTIARWAPGALLAAALLAAHPAQAQATYTFDSDAVGTATTFTDTDNGIAATFSSPATPHAYVVESASGIFGSGSALQGHALVDLFNPNTPLDITFSTPLQSFSLNFAYIGKAGDGDVLSLAAFSGGVSGTLIGGSTALGAGVPGSRFPEGLITFSSAAPFDTVALSIKSGTEFAVDNVHAVPAAVPEASTTVSFGLLAFGLGGVLVAAKRKTA